MRWLSLRDRPSAFVISSSRSSERGELAVVERLRDRVELGVVDVRLPQWRREARVGVEEREVRAQVARDCRRDPAARVDVEEAVRRVAVDRDRARLGRRCAGSARSGSRSPRAGWDVVTDLDALGAVAADEQLDDDGFAAVVPHAVDLRRAQALHLLGDDGVGLGQVVGVLELRARMTRCSARSRRGRVEGGPAGDPRPPWISCTT